MIVYSCLNSKRLDKKTTKTVSISNNTVQKIKALSFSTYLYSSDPELLEKELSPTGSKQNKHRLCEHNLSAAMWVLGGFEGWGWLKASEHCCDLVFMLLYL